MWIWIGVYLLQSCTKGTLLGKLVARSLSEDPIELWAEEEEEIGSEPNHRQNIVVPLEHISIEGIAKEVAAADNAKSDCGYKACIVEGFEKKFRLFLFFVSGYEMLRF